MLAKNMSVWVIVDEYPSYNNKHVLHMSKGVITNTCFDGPTKNKNYYVNTDLWLGRNWYAKEEIFLDEISCLAALNNINSFL